MFLYDRTINTSQVLLAAHENHYQARRTQEQKRLLMHYKNEFNARNSLMKNIIFIAKRYLKSIGGKKLHAILIINTMRY